MSAASQVSGVKLQASPGRTMEDAFVDAKDAETATRRLMAVTIAALFIGLNGSVMWFVHCVHQTDVELLKLGLKADPTVNTNVLMSLIGATVIQAGFAIKTIIGNLFPSSRQPQ